MSTSGQVWISAPVAEVQKHPGLTRELVCALQVCDWRCLYFHGMAVVAGGRQAGSAPQAPARRSLSDGPLDGHPVVKRYGGGL